MGDIRDLPVKASSAIYEGSAIGFVSGYHRQLASTDEFCGFALNDVASQSSDGAAYVRTRRKGVIALTISSIAVTDIGKPVYASDGNAFTLTAGTDAHIGRVVGVYAADTALVAFDADRGGLGGQIALLTDSSGGTASDTIADTPASYTEATLANTTASIVAKLNQLLRMLG